MLERSPMIGRILARLTYANVMATVAVFLALGGGAYAAATIGSSDIQRDAIKSRHVDPGEILSSDVARDALRGKDIEEKSLDGVLGCPDGLERAADVCFEEDPNPDAGFEEALNTCAARERRLPTLAEGILLERIAEPDLYWTQEVDTQGTNDKSDDEAILVGEDDYFVQGVSETFPYTCVTSPTG